MAESETQTKSCGFTFKKTGKNRNTRTRKESSDEGISLITQICFGQIGVVQSFSTESTETDFVGE